MNTSMLKDIINNIGKLYTYIYIKVGLSINDKVKFSFWTKFEA